MQRRILYEADNLTLAAGTGIATYARNLVQAARGLGYDADVLVGSWSPLTEKDPALNEIRFYEARLATARRPAAHLLELGGNWLYGSPLGVKPTKVTRTGAVVDPQPGRYDAFETIYAIPSIVDKATFHFQRLGTPLRVKLERKPDLFHLTQAIPMAIDGVPNIYTLHDIIPLRLPYTTIDNKKHMFNLFRDIARRADHIVTVSEFSRRDIMSVLGVEEKRITNTYQAVSLPKDLAERPMDEVAGELAGAFSLDVGEYFLFVGAIEPKKNLGRLIDAYAASGSKRPLVVVGKNAWLSSGDVRKMRDDRFVNYRIVDGNITSSRRIRHLSYVPFDQLISLMRGARALVFPSLYEGFGLPVLEAMLLGTPVITSNTSSLPEVAGDAAILVPPTDAAALTRAIRMIDADDNVRAEYARRGPIRAREFSPERYRERIDQLYRGIIG